jgi:ADP-ribose pyrophosphatase YjhB (NUDIX family)
VAEVNQVHTVYGNQVRVRACGLCFHHEKILLVNHRFITATDFWAPPGGGVALGESAGQCVEREFMEETHLTVKAGEFLFACELIRTPLHAVELFFSIESWQGRLRAGNDPEWPHQGPSLTEAGWFSISQIKSMAPGTVHGIFLQARDLSEIKAKRGFFKL